MSRPSVDDALDFMIHVAAKHVLIQDQAEAEAAAGVLEDLRAALADWHETYTAPKGLPRSFYTNSERLARLLAPREGAE